MKLRRAALAALIPHAGSMCLLGAVEHVTATEIVCSAVSHLDADNPLRCNGRLDAIASVEYASQAVAVHSALGAPAGAGVRRGYLARIRDVALDADVLDAEAAPLRVAARQIAASRDGASYTFEVTAAGVALARGTLLIVLGEPVPPR